MKTTTTQKNMPNKVPMRKCVGCNQSKPKKELTRVAFYEGNLTVDFTGRAKGRGVYLCSDKECRENALKRNALSRSFKTNFDRDVVEKIFKELDNDPK